MREVDARSEAELLRAARGGDPAGFERLVEPYRGELYAHCYRMLGSVQDAEDALQESLLGAWRGIAGFEGRSSLRAWLYRVSTNACLRLIAGRPRRMRSPDHGPPRRDTADLGEPVEGPVWLEPFPDEQAPADPDDGDPATSYLRRESVELAFVAALQHLPGTQRAVLILREVLGFSAAEVAGILETTPASVNSALQRARKAVAERMPATTQQVELAALGQDGRRELVDAFVAAWERADVPALLALLAEDARFTMPPLPAWFDGRADVARFFAERVFATRWRLLPIRANGQLAFACYQGEPGGGRFRLGAINLLRLRDGRIVELAGFLDPALHRHFGLPEELPAGEARGAERWVGGEELSAGPDRGIAAMNFGREDVLNLRRVPRAHAGRRRHMADKQRRAAGPLVVASANPRYFTVESADPAGQRAVYLTGSHIWNNFHDGMGPGAACAEQPERNDYGAYLDFLEEHGHNFIRMWRWEHFRSQAAGGAFHLCMRPQPWPRTGPGTASDGGPKFDLSRFDQAYFDRLRERVVAAGERGIYVAVMLFDGWALHLSPPPDNLEGHPFHAANNLGQAAITSILDYQVLPLDPRVQALQEAYVRKVVDTVQDLPNVLYEVANESTGDPTNPEVGDSTQWQYWVIELLKRHERDRGYDQHPVGMTMQYPVPDQRKVNEPLFNGPADWVSPGFDDQQFDPASGQGPPASTRWFTNPPPADGTKVVISDTDHYAPGRGDALWAWKSFLRGHHPILMDYGIIDVAHPLDPSLGVPSYDSFEAGRYAMGDTRRFAEDVDLIRMEPRGELSSTGYALANPGREYLVLDPDEDGGQFTVSLPAGGYAAAWYSVAGRETAVAPEVTVDGSTAAAFRAPFQAAGPAVLHLRRTGS